MLGSPGVQDRLTLTLTGLTAGQAAAVAGDFAEIKHQHCAPNAPGHRDHPGTEAIQAPQVPAVPSAWGKTNASHLQKKRKAHRSTRFPWGKAGTNPADTSYPVRVT